MEKFIRQSHHWDGFYNHVQRLNDKMIEYLADGEVKFDYADKRVTYPYVESEWVIEEL